MKRMLITAVLALLALDSSSLLAQANEETDLAAQNKLLKAQILSQQTEIAEMKTNVTRLEAQVQRLRDGTEPQEGTQQPEPASRPSGTIGKWEGARGIAWRSDIKTLKGFDPLGGQGNEGCYVRPSDTLTHADIMIADSILYYFHNDRFYRVVISGCGYDNTVKGLTKRYGPGVDKSSGGRSVSAIYNHTWTDGQTEIKIVTDGQNYPSAVLTYIHISSAEEADRAAKKQNADNAKTLLDGK